jgi:hypothetical protein
VTPPLPGPQTQTSFPTVCFIFILETTQTALTGADVYYWFMAGFGDLDGITLNSRFTPIDLPMIGGTVALVVQLFFCYRINTLNKRLWWLCTVIAVVSLPPTSVSAHSSSQWKSYLLLKRLGPCGKESW